MLNRDLGSAALLRQLVASTVGVAVLTGAGEAGTALWHRATTLPVWATWLVRAAARAVVVVGAERAVAANRSRVLTVPRREAAESTWAAGESSAEVHVAKPVDQSVLAALSHAGGRGHQCGCS